MSWASSGPAAMAALAATFKTIPLNGEVRDGPEVGDSAAWEVITVGYVGPDDDTAVEASSTPGGLGMREREQYTVNCAVAVVNGDEDIRAARQRAFDLLAQCGLRLAADPKLAGSVMKAEISSWSLREDMATGGAHARLRFGVGIDAFTSA